MKEPNQSNKWKAAIILTIAVLLGIGIQFTNPVGALLICFIWLLAVLFSIAAIIQGIFRKRFRGFYLVGFLPIITGYSFMTIVREYKKNKAEYLITQLEKFKERNGDYPKDLTELQYTIHITGLTYEADSRLQEFRLEYLMDQFNRQCYKSKSQEWGTLGWND